MNNENNPFKSAARIGYWASLLVLIFLILHGLLYYPVIKAGIGPMDKFNVESYATSYLKAGILTNGFLPQISALIAVFSFLVISACLYVVTTTDKKIFALLSLCLSIMANTLLSMGYFANWVCFQRSALAGDFSGLAHYTEGNFNSFVFSILVLSVHILLSASFLFLVPLFTKNKKDKIIGILLLLTGISMIPSIISLATGIFPLLFIHDGIATFAMIAASILLMGYWKRIEKTSSGA